MELDIEPIKRSEHVEQREFVSWFRRQHFGVLIFAIPNGGKRGKAEAARLKVEGVTAGIPDLQVPEWNLWIEMKTPTGKVSPEQKEMMNYLSSIGHHCLVCYGKEDAIEKIINFRQKKFDS